MIAAIRQNGFTLVSALFLLVVVAALALSLSRVMVGARVGTSREILTTRAYYAARSGLDYAVATIVSSAACPGNPPAIEGFAVTIDSCSMTPVLEGTTNYTVFDLQVTARSGSKSSSSLVRRTLRASVKNP